MIWKEKINLKIPSSVVEAMSKGGIAEEDVREVIKRAESTGEKLFLQGEKRYLAKARIKNITVYVEYSPAPEKNTFDVHTVYAHRAEIKGVVE